MDERTTAMEEISAMRPTITETLKHRKARLEDELGRVNSALQALEENPTVAEVFDLVAKATRY